jgi:hypothetical protein
MLEVTADARELIQRRLHAGGVAGFCFLSQGSRATRSSG